MASNFAIASVFARQHIPQTCAAGLFALALHQPVSAAETTPEWFEHTQENAWLANDDPTLVSRRVLSEFSYERDNNEDIWKIENSLRWGFALQKGLAFGVQALIPIKWIDSPTSDDFGPGDLELGATRVWGARHQYALSSGTEVPLSSDSLSFKLITGFTWYF